MDHWQNQLKYDPIPIFLVANDPALIYFVRRDLLDEDPGPVQQLWELRRAQKILKKQLPDGSWPRAGTKNAPGVNYELIETWRNFRVLVGQYGFTLENPQARRAAEFLFSCQTETGDFRGFLANQYATYYTGAILGLLMEAGCVEDPRIEKGMQWLLHMRQADGGWTIPILTHAMDRATQYRLTSQYADPLEPDRTRPFSHNWTGMVLRAFAAHPYYRSSPVARRAAELLKSRFFRKDVYSSYQSASYWVRFDYPFWWNNLAAALDTLAKICLPVADPDIRRGLDWLLEHQETSGLWKLGYGLGDRSNKQARRGYEKQLWVSLAICRILKMFLG